MRTLRFPGQRLLVSLLALVALFGLAGTILVGWTRDHVLDEQGYVDTVAPLAKDDAIQEAVATKATDQIAAAFNAQFPFDSQLSQLPGPLGQATNRANATTRTFMHDTIKAYVASPQFQQLWIAANRSAHNQMVDILLDKSNANTRAGNVVLDLSAIYAAIRTQIVGVGQPQIAAAVPWDSLALKIDVMRTSVLEPAKKPTQWIDKYGGYFPIVTIVAAVLALLLARHRRFVAGFLGIGAIVVGLLTVGGVAVASAAIKSELPPVDDVIGGRGFDIITESLRHRGVVAAIGGAILVGVALLPWPRLGRAVSGSTALAGAGAGAGGGGYDPSPYGGGGAAGGYNPSPPVAPAHPAPSYPPYQPPVAPAYRAPEPANYPSTTPYGQPADPYGRPNDPYGQPADPYGQPADPYGRPNDPYGQPADPYGQPSYAEPAADPRQAASPYGQPAVDPWASPHQDPPTTPLQPDEESGDPPTQILP